MKRSGKRISVIARKHEESKPRVLGGGKVSIREVDGVNGSKYSRGSRMHVNQLPKSLEFFGGPDQQHDDYDCS